MMPITELQALDRMLGEIRRHLNRLEELFSTLESNINWQLLDAEDEAGEATTMTIAEGGTDAG